MIEIVTFVYNCAILNSNFNRDPAHAFHWTLGLSGRRHINISDFRRFDLISAFIWNIE